jgi:uncharacterized damage-inducible protein DinB
MKSHFTEIFEYNHDSNVRLIDALEEESRKLNERAIKLFSHTLNAHHIWLSRIEAKVPKFEVFELLPVVNFRDLNSRNHIKTLEIIDNKELNEVIQYSNSKGIEFQNSLKDILFHLVNHSTYHRAQIASEMVALDIQPVASDYIHYKR